MQSIERPDAKIVSSLSDLSLRCEVLRGTGETVVLTSGCFDLLHGSHVEYVWDAAEMGTLVLGINSDVFVRRLKGENRPIRSEEDRALTAAAWTATKFVVVFDDDLELIRAVRPAIYVASNTSHVLIGEDLSRVALLHELGCEIRELKSTRPQQSTTALIRRAANV